MKKDRITICILLEGNKAKKAKFIVDIEVNFHLLVPWELAHKQAAV